MCASLCFFLVVMFVEMRSLDFVQEWCVCTLPRPRPLSPPLSPPLLAKPPAPPLGASVVFPKYILAVEVRNDDNGEEEDDDDLLTSHID